MTYIDLFDMTYINLLEYELPWKIQFLSESVSILRLRFDLNIMGCDIVISHRRIIGLMEGFSQPICNMHIVNSIGIHIMCTNELPLII